MVWPQQRHQQQQQPSKPTPQKPPVVIAAGGPNFDDFEEDDPDEEPAGAGPGALDLSRPKPVPGKNQLQGGKNQIKNQDRGDWAAGEGDDDDDEDMVWFGSVGGLKGEI